MLFIKSKIQFFESKSQLISISWAFRNCCLSSQRYNFLKANHNQTAIVGNIKEVVYQVKDTIFWKQITTLMDQHQAFRLLFIKSKIQFFESKSQPQFDISDFEYSCLSSQRYNFLKANHNKSVTQYVVTPVVYQVKDTIFWKQITTIHAYRLDYLLLFIKSKIQFFESKSQQSAARKINCGSCLSSQRYNFLKANHNDLLTNLLLIEVVYQVKDTIFWKQITTIIHITSFFVLLFIKSKIQFFESKSQLRDRYLYSCYSCLSSQRYNFLKANHNSFLLYPYWYNVVYQVKDTIFWKQITTCTRQCSS